MLTLLGNLLGTATHLKASTLGAYPAYYIYTDRGWQPITKARFDLLISSGRFYKHESACSTWELIYNRKRAGLDNSNGTNSKDQPLSTYGSNETDAR